MDHRSLSEIVFGGVLKDYIDPRQVVADSLIEPYNAAIEAINDSDISTAELKAEFGFDAIRAAQHAVETVSIHEMPDFLDQLNVAAERSRIAGTLKKAAKAAEQNQEPDLAEIRAYEDAAVKYQPVSAWDVLQKMGTEHEWIWNPWIPRGTLTIIGGEEGHGKTTLALTLIRVITDGLELPDGSKTGTKGKVVFVETEGKLRSALINLEAWGYNIEKAELVLPASRSMNLEDANDRALIKQAAMTKGIVAIIVDTLSGATDEENDPKVKRVSGFLSRMAEELNIAVIATHHLSKMPKGTYRKRVEVRDFRGHGGITQFATSLIGVLHINSAHPERAVNNAKNNAATPGADFGFLIDEHTGEVTWDDAPAFPTKASKPQQAAEFLRRELKNGPQEPRHLKARALQQHGIKDWAVLQAKRELGIIHFKDGYEKWFWKLSRGRGKSHSSTTSK